MKHSRPIGHYFFTPNIDDTAEINIVLGAAKIPAGPYSPDPELRRTGAAGSGRSTVCRRWRQAFIYLVEVSWNSVKIAATPDWLVAVIFLYCQIILRLPVYSKIGCEKQPILRYNI